MIVAVAVVEIQVHGSHSLKQKRGVVRTIVQRLRNRFDVSVAEVGGQDTWQRAVLGLATVGIDGARARLTLERAVEFIEGLHLAEVRRADVEVVQLPHETTSGPEGEDRLPWEEE